MLCGLRIELAELRAAVNRDPVVFGQRDRFLGDQTGDPRRDGGAIEPLVSSTAPCHGSMPLGGTNSIVASSAILLSGTKRTSRVERIAGGRWQRAVRGIGSATGEHLVATGASCRGVDMPASDQTQRDRRQCECKPIVRPPLRNRWIRRFDDRIGSGDGAADRDPLTGLQWADDRPIHVRPSSFERASARRSRGTDVALRVVELEAHTTTSNRPVSNVSSVPMMSRASWPVDSCALGSV